MLDRLARFLEVSPTVAAILLSVIGLQVLTQLYAFLDLARREEVRGGRKWIWAVVIGLGNLPGAIAYLVAGRSVRTTDVGDGTVGGDAARRAVDALYGPRDR